jgi:hypothetical protein
MTNTELSAQSSNRKVVARPERTGRPPPSRCCDARSWWNGWRLVFSVVKDVVTGRIESCERWLTLGKCTKCKQGFTCYPDDQYPHRQYQLDVVADVVAGVALGGESLKQAAGRAEASSTSVRRWTEWISQLGPLDSLLAVVQRLEPSTAVSVGLSAVTSREPMRSRAGQVLKALEEMGQRLVRNGVKIACATGLGRVLGWQRQAHGDVVHLVTEPRMLSPAMAIEARRLGV